MSINSVTISGNLTADVVVRQTNGGMSVYSFGVAVNERRKNQQTGEWEDVPNFVDCTIFDREGKRAWMVNCLRKGFKVLVHGRLQQDKWTDQQGNNRSVLRIIVNDIDAQWPPRQDGGYQQQPAQRAQTSQSGYFQGVTPIPAQQPAQQQPAQQPAQPAQDDFYDDSIPF